MENQLDKMFRKGLEGKENQAPSASWAQMEALLDAQASGAEPKKKRGFIWYWAAAVLVPLFIFVWFIVEKEPKKPEWASNNTKPPKQEILSLKSAREEKINLISVEKPENPELKKLAAAQPQKIEKIKIQGLSTLNLKTDESQQIISENEDIAKNSATEIPDLSSENQTISSQSKEEEIGYEIASIEFRKGSRPTEKPELANEMASIEWRPGKPQKPNWAERIAHLKSGHFEKVPSMAEAKENLVALLSFKK
jgi:hypothetical protein